MCRRAFNRNRQNRERLYSPPLVTVSSVIKGPHLSSFKYSSNPLAPSPPEQTGHCARSSTNAPRIYIPRNELRRRLIYSRQFVPGLIKHVHPPCAHPGNPRKLRQRRESRDRPPPLIVPSNRRLRQSNESRLVGRDATSLIHGTFN